jgi:hypothetical protein
LSFFNISEEIKIAQANSQAEAIKINTTKNIKSPLERLQTTKPTIFRNVAIITHHR